METSDSECFESADEDFNSEDEDVRTVISDDGQKKVVEEKTRIEDDCVKKKGDKDQEIVENEKKQDIVELRTKQEIVEVQKPRIVEVEEPVEVEKPKEVKKPKESKIGKLGTKTMKSNITSKKDSEKVEPLSYNLEEKCTLNTEDKEKESENLWEDDVIDWGKEEQLEAKAEAKWEDDWEPVENINKENVIPENKDSWGSWGNWGVSSILNTATQSVSTLTNHVSQGLSTVLESGIGVPDPEDLARQHKANEAELKEKIKNLNVDGSPVQQNSLGGFGLGNWVSGVSHLTKFVETTGTKVISGGLDTLETIGKKTMEVLQEGDPGLKKKRAFLKLDQNKPILSQVLREAKEKADEENRDLEQKHFRRKAKNYETLFDDHQGLVHLEALEMLSKQCDIKLETLIENCNGEALVEMQETLDQVKELCELPEEDEDEQLTFEEIKERIDTAVSEININISYNKLISTWNETEEWLENIKLNIVDEAELHQQSIETLAQLTAIAVEQFHKAGELLLVKEHRSTADEADSLVQLTTSLIALIGIMAAKFSDKLNSKAKNKEAVNELITNVFFEASNSSSYIQDAFQLLIPVLQVGAV